MFKAFSLYEDDLKASFWRLGCEESKERKIRIT